MNTTCPRCNALCDYHSTTAVFWSAGPAHTRTALSAPGIHRTTVRDSLVYILIYTEFDSSFSGWHRAITVKILDSATRRLTLESGIMSASFM